MGGLILGTALLATLDRAPVTLGVAWSRVLIADGLALGVLMIVADGPMILLTLLTATTSAATTVTGAMLSTGAVDSNDFGGGVWGRTVR